MLGYCGTKMGNHLQATKSSQYVTNHPDPLSLTIPPRQPQSVSAKHAQ